MKVTPSGRRAGILFAANPDQPPVLMNGIEISQGQIARAGLHWEWYLRSSAPCEWGTISLTPEDLAAAGQTIIGRELALPTFVHSVTPPLAALSRLRKLHEAAGHLAKTAPDILAKSEVARAMELALVEAMVFCLADGQYQDARNVQRSRARVMRRVEEVLMTNPDEPLDAVTTNPAKSSRAL
jgi:hypothetical protein